MEIISFIQSYQQYQFWMEPQNTQDTSQPMEFKQPDYNQLSEAEREAEFKKQHQDYIAEKMLRKKQMAKARKAEFGSSSSDSDEDDFANSESCPSSVDKKQSGAETNVGEKKPSFKVDAEVVDKIPVLLISKKSSKATKTGLVFCDNGTFMIEANPFQLKLLTKIKIIAEKVANSPFKIKITYDKTEIMLAVDSNILKIGLPIHYYTFAKFIQEELLAGGVKLRQNIEEKIPGVPQSLVAGSLIYGKILKKSQFLGKWEERFILINKEGVYSFKKFNEKHSMFIQKGAIKQLWTRFEIHQHFLIIKIMHNGIKTELGIPMADYLSARSWLFHFYGMLPSSK